MKKLILISVLILVSTNTSYAIGKNQSQFYDKGLIYTNSSYPQSAAAADSADLSDLSCLKKGESSMVNIFNLVETGDASINAAAKNGNIKKIYYVDYKIGKVYIPLLFIPIYVKEKKTIVYGE